MRRPSPDLTEQTTVSYRGHRFPPDVVSLGVWLYYRFPLGLRMVEEMKQASVDISMDGKGRALDNVFIERLWRSLKYEEIYLHEYDDGRNLFGGLRGYFGFYNYERPHQALGYFTPAQVYRNGRESLLI